MKKVAMFFACILAAMVDFAQLHSFRDTAQVKYWQFDVEVWLRSDSHTQVTFEHYLYFPTSFGLGCSFTEDIVQYNYTDNPSGVEVVGLSGVICCGNSTQLHYPMSPPEYLLLYDASTDTFELKGQLQWEETDTAGRPFYDFLYRGPDTIWNMLGSIGKYYIFDLYFDKPITVYDSFYVGCTGRNFVNIEETPITSLSSCGVYQLWRYNDSIGMPSRYCCPMLWKIYEWKADYTYPQYQWTWVPSYIFLMVLPIINVVDTSFANAPACPKVSGLFLRGNNTDTVTLQWAQDSLHGEFEVSYGPNGTAPGDGTVATVNDNRWHFTDIAYSDTLMVAYVRTVCREYDTLRWSGWSSPMNFRLHYVDTTTHHEEGIVVPEEGDDLSRFVQLMPNPASGSVLVMSSYGMERVEVYDARGSKVYDSPADGTTAGFDVSSWAKGAYVVHVRTHAGTTVKRLVVQ